MNPEYAHTGYQIPYGQRVRDAIWRKQLLEVGRTPSPGRFYPCLWSQHGKIKTMIIESFSGQFICLKCHRKDQGERLQELLTKVRVG